jgi:hypothetical protein
MYNPVILELVNRENLQRMQAELSAYESISRAESGAKLVSESDHSRAGAIQLTRRFLALLRKKVSTSPVSIH